MTYRKPLYDPAPHEGISLKSVGAWYIAKLVSEGRRDEYMVIRGASAADYDRLRDKMGCDA